MISIIFTRSCVFVVLFAIISLVTSIIDRYTVDDATVAWFISSIGFTVFLTETLIHYGII